jgi:hypothetical protein
LQELDALIIAVDIIIDDGSKAQPLMVLFLMWFDRFLRYPF